MTGHSELVADLKQSIIALEQKLSAVSTERDELFEQQAATAEVLKVISRSKFDLRSVMDTIARSACQLCKADLGAVFLRDGDMLVNRGVFHANEEMADFMRHTPVPINDESYMGRAVLTGEISNIADFEQDTTSKLRKFQKVYGFKAILFVPLMREGRGIGSFSLARNYVGAFSQREVELVNTFADQAVIALENVRLFEQVQQRTKELAASLDDLRAAQDRLVQTEKLASLGQLTAGIAHEINSPIGTGLTIASSLSQRCQIFAAEQASGQLRRSQLAAFVDGTRDATKQLVVNLTRAGELVQFFKQVAVDQVPADRHLFDLNRATTQILASLQPNLAGLDVAVETDVPDGIMMNSYPAPYGQVLSNLFLNAVAHGFERTRAGRITFMARRRDAGQVEIIFSDDGRGMSEVVQRRAFDPFFTTNRNGGGTGLGLHIVHNIVTQRLGGNIVLKSEPERGATFIISLPVNSPG